MKSLRKLWPKLKNNFPSLILVLFLLAIGCLLYTNLGRDYLFDWDEGIYAELGRELLITKNFFVSFWNGSVWLEKPPGITWISALGVVLAGSSALGARLLMPLISVYTLYIVYRIGKHFGSWQQGLLAAGVLATFNLFLGRTRAINTDMPLLASITTTILFLLENRPAWWVALAVFGGVWFKGLAGFLSLLIALPLFLSKSKSYLLKSIVYILALSLPWHLYAFFAYGSDFTTPYFFEQVIKRATTQIEFHFENRWYYFTYLYENLGLGVLLLSVFGAITTLVKRQHRYLLWWAFVPLVIFTLAKTRLFWYILPLYPALALLISLALTSFGSFKPSRQIITIITLGILLQGIITTSRSVELTKKVVPPPDRIRVVQELSAVSQEELLVLVPKTERLAEALLPTVARLSSSFRYGGMPSVVFYYQGQIQFFYNVDTFNEYFATHNNPALISAEDQQFLTPGYTIVSTTPTYLGIRKVIYAFR